MSGPRRTASPVRLSLTNGLGGDIDGAWWPHTASIARELPELIGALHSTLGEVVDITVNWSVTAAAPALTAPHAAAMATMRWNDRRQRIMVVVGRTACARLLVVPHMTTPALGRMVLRRAAELPIALAEHDTPEFEAADRVVRSAEAESASWAARMAGAAVVPDGS